MTLTQILLGMDFFNPQKAKNPNLGRYANKKKGKHK